MYILWYYKVVWKSFPFFGVSCGLDFAVSVGLKTNRRVPKHFVKMQFKPVILSIFFKLGVFFVSCVYYPLTNFYHVSLIAFCQCDIDLPKQPYTKFSQKFFVMRSLLSCLPSQMFCCISPSVVGIWKGYINLKRCRRRNCEN